MKSGKKVINLNMSKALENKIETIIFDFFVNSNDFNGIPIWTLVKKLKKSKSTIIDAVKKLVIENKVSIQSSTNPHIIHSRHYDTNSQLKILEHEKKVGVKTRKYGGVVIVTPSTNYPICLYPSREILISKRNIELIKDSPYTLQLALSEPQLKPIFFDIDVLDRYNNDPRYNFKFRDYSGSISHFYDENNNPVLREEDQIFIQSFGLGFNCKGDRLAVVYLRYLNDLTKEHQQYWKSKEHKLPATMIKEYYENTFLGEWTNSHSIFQALLKEITIASELSVAIFGRSIFKKKFDNEESPKGFTFFFSPTLKNYHDFILLLDKMITENINIDFFKGQLELFRYNRINATTFERVNKGSLSLFEEWLSLNFITEDKRLIKDIFSDLRKIRQARQNPAHKIEVNKYDKKFIELQKETMKNAYSSIRAIREIFGQHPKAISVEIPEWLNSDRIKIY